MRDYIQLINFCSYLWLCILLAGCTRSAPLHLVGNAKAEQIAELRLDGTILYVLGRLSLSIYDLTDPIRPKLINSLPLNAKGNKTFAVHVGYAYLANKLEGLAVINVRDLGHSLRPMTILTEVKANGIAVADDIAYVMGDTPEGAGLHLYDIRDPHKFTKLSFVKGATTKAGSVAIALRNRFIYTFQPTEPGRYDFQVWDATNPRQPRLVQNFPDFVLGGDIELVGDRAYVSTLANLSIFEITSSGKLERIGSYSRNFGSTYAIAVDGGYLYTASQLSVRAFELTKRWGPIRTHRTEVSQARDILVYKGYLYVADLTDGLLIFKTLE